MKPEIQHCYYQTQLPKMAINMNWPNMIYSPVQYVSIIALFCIVLVVRLKQNLL
jgi:hypothetical protein